MKIAKPKEKVNKRIGIPSADCVVGELYLWEGVPSASPRLCVEVGGNKFLISLKTGIQRNSCLEPDFRGCKYIHLPDAYVVTGESE